MSMHKVFFEIEFDTMILEIPVSIEAKSFNEAIKIANNSPEIYLTKAYAAFFKRQAAAKISSKAGNDAKRVKRELAKKLAAKRAARVSRVTKAKIYQRKKA